MKHRLNSHAEAENIGLELGQRAFSALCAENDHPKFIQGISDLFFLTDPYEDWSDIIALSRQNDLPSFSLIQGLRIMVGDWKQRLIDRFPHTSDATVREILEHWFYAWESTPDWDHEEAMRAMHWENWVAEGGMDDEV